MEAQSDMNMGAYRRGPSAGLVVFLAIIFGAIAGFGGTILALWAGQHGYLTQVLGNSDISGPKATVTTASTTGTQTTHHGFAAIAEKINASVVNVKTTAVQQDPMSLFFGGGGQREVTGLGTGVIVDEKGDILTNYHVVGEADKITVTVMEASGPKEYPATLIGGDKQEDMAVIKINAKGLKAVQFGDSEALLPGDPVMAIGNPFGFEHTVSVGVISALNRQLPVEETVTLRGMIQTDASINPGNSGGPLVNENGQVIGINTAIFLGGGSGSGQPQANGIGFAIPSNHAHKVMEMILAHGKVQHPYLGVKYMFLSSELRNQEHLPYQYGVIVRSIFKGGPADKGGLQVGDIIESVDSQQLKDKDALGNYVAKVAIGKRIAMKIHRWDNGQNAWADKTLNVTIQDMPKDFTKAMTEKPAQGDAQNPDGSDQQPQQRERSFPFPSLP
ncbi:MAG TPA: trypsin-like peptidase domain-containing protein [Armatimonadota bacterium]|jgi:S1-C subfamily serine protease